MHFYVQQFYKTLRAWNAAGRIISPIDIIIIIYYLCAEYLKFTCLKQTIFLRYKVL